MDAEELREVEPHARGVAALHSPETGVVDFAQVARALRAPTSGGRRRDRPAARSIASSRAAARVACATRRRAARRFAVFCAGAADQLAVEAGADADPRIVPFRGAYLKLRPEQRATWCAA